ncbi:MAG: NAD(P)/FAD-dependent oxidoreductase [Sphingobium sp.]
MQKADAVIVGAGFAGLYMLYKLRQQGLEAIGFEAGTDVGGTWYWNRYPGARCDVDSIEYSFSFDAELEQEWRWKERYATQPEILSYLSHVADRHDLRKDFRFETRVTAATFDDVAQRWTVETDRGDRVSARYFIGAVGCLSQPKDPDIEGMGSFRGAVHFTSRWPSGPLDFAGKRVGVIGTGSTGTQIIPLLAKEAGELVVFQRTPNFSMPARNAPISDARDRELKDNYPALRELGRRQGASMVEFSQVSALEVSPERRLEIFEERWQLGGPVIQASFNDIMIDPKANESAAQFVRGKIAEIVRDPVVARRLTPTGYPIGAKRVCVDTDYYTTFNRDNVRLVDLRETPLVRVTAAGVEAGAEEIPLDVLIFATGFDAITGPMLAMDIRGRDGLSLRDKWDHGPRTYLGLAIAGFPNLFVITGPGSPSVLGNVVIAIEQHVEWIDRLIAHMQAKDFATIEARPEAEAQWVEHVNLVAQGTLYTKANSWYMGANIPGKPRMFMAYVGGMEAYRAQCEAVAADGYAGFTLSHETVSL